MQVYLFRGPGRIFAVTEDPQGTNLPAKYAPWVAIKSIELQKGQEAPGLDVEECLQDLEIHRIHITDAHVRITEVAIA